MQDLVKAFQKLQTVAVLVPVFTKYKIGLWVVGNPFLSKPEHLTDDEYTAFCSECQAALSKCAQ